jgi:hypothetical protein
VGRECCCRIWNSEVGTGDGYGIVRGLCAYLTWCLPIVIPFPEGLFIQHFPTIQASLVLKHERCLMSHLKILMHPNIQRKKCWNNSMYSILGMSADI